MLAGKSEYGTGLPSSTRRRPPPGNAEYAQTTPFRPPSPEHFLEPSLLTRSSMDAFMPDCETTAGFPPPHAISNAQAAVPDTMSRAFMDEASFGCSAGDPSPEHALESCYVASSRSTSASKAGQCRGCGTRVPERKREQAASDRPTACAISPSANASSFGGTSRRTHARSRCSGCSFTHSPLRRCCSALAAPPPRASVGAYARVEALDTLSTGNRQAGVEKLGHMENIG